MKATLQKITWLTPERIAAFWFQPERRYTFVPGEYTELFVPHANPDNRGQSRELSIASTPEDTPFIKIITTFPPADQRQSTFKQALRALAIGDEVDLSQPRGDFVLPKDPSIPLVFIAGGIGVVPFLSIAGHLAHKTTVPPISLIHSVNTEQALLGKPFVGTNVFQQYIPIITNGSQPGLVGRIRAHDILEAVQPKPQTLFYISGPESMTQEMRNQLLAKGIASPQIVLDEFNRYDP